jgi:hypothetical protein
MEAAAKAAAAAEAERKGRRKISGRSIGNA